jgi:hypothetical protein
VRTSAPAQNDPSAVFECSSQLPSRRCDDRLNPPYERGIKWWLSDPNASNFRFAQDVNWTYDGHQHVEAVDPLPVIVMGFNNGDGNGATPTRLSGSELRRRTQSNKLAAGFGDGQNQGRYVLAELIPLHSLTKGELKKKYGGDLEPAFAAGADMNRAVIAHHRPKIIFQAGITGTDLAIVSQLYGLTFVDSSTRPNHPTHTLLKLYLMADGTPWLAFRHFASYGFSDRDLEAIRDYARMVMATLAA